MSDLAQRDECTIVLGNVPATDAFGLSLSVDDDSLLETVTAMGPGLFRRDRGAVDGPFAVTGAFVTRGNIIGFLQRGVLLMPVLMPLDGWLLGSAADGARVEHGSPVFRYLRATDAIIP